MKKLLKVLLAFSISFLAIAGSISVLSSTANAMPVGTGDEDGGGVGGDQD